jgi:hypothetical protein
MLAIATVTAGFKCPPLMLPTQYTPTVTASGPAGGDDDPAGVLAFGFVEEDVGHDAIAEQDEDRGADEFSEEG